LSKTGKFGEKYLTKNITLFAQKSDYIFGRKKHKIGRLNVSMGRCLNQDLGYKFSSNFIEFLKKNLDNN